MTCLNTTIYQTDSMAQCVCVCVSVCVCEEVSSTARLIPPVTGGDGSSSSALDTRASQ